MDKRKVKVSKNGKDSTKKKTLKRTSKKNVKNSRVCGSGNPMPSYKKLKAMYEDNTNEEIQSEVSSSATNREIKMSPVKVENSLVNRGEMLSPNTLKYIAARALEYLQATDLVPSVKNIDKVTKDLNFASSNGVVDHTERVNEIFTKQRTKKKVIILGDDDDNPQLPEICLGDEFSIPNSGDNKDTEAADSDSTVNYDVDEFMNTKTVTKEVIRKSPEQSFSPIPSTSRNQKIFEQNDIIYEKCVLQSKANVSSALKEISTNVQKARTPSPGVKMEMEVIVVDSQLPDSSQDTENKMQTFDKLLEQVDLEESDNGDVVIVNVDDVIQENKALFKKFKSENNSDPEPSPSVDISSTENRNLKSILDVTPKEEIVIEDDVIQTKKREEEMSQIVTNYFKQQTPIVINDTLDSVSDEECTSTSNDNDLLNTIVKYIASTQLVRKTKALVNQAFESTENKTTHRKRVNRIAGSCQIVDFVNLDNYASPIKATKVFDDEIIILDDTDTSVSICNDNFKDSNVPSTSADLDNSPSTSQGVCQTSTPFVATQARQRHRKRKSNQTNVNITKDDTPKRVRTEDAPLNETQGTPKRNIGDCPICLEALTAKPISSTVCGHIFCLLCMQTIMKTSKRCPTCRKVLRGAKAYHPIFL